MAFGSLSFRFRCDRYSAFYAKMPEWEFAVEFTLDGTTGVPCAGGDKVHLGALSIGTFHPYNSLKIEELPVAFPRVPYRSRG
jgi:hypothetical protein